MLGGDHLYASEFDVFRRQNFTYNADPRTERIETFIMTADPWHRYANETEEAN